MERLWITRVSWMRLRRELLDDVLDDELPADVVDELLDDESDELDEELDDSELPPELLELFFLESSRLSVR